MKKLATRILLYFVIVIILTTSSIGFAGYFRSAKELEKQYQGLMAQIVDNVVHQTDSYLQNTERATLSILTSELVKEAFDLQPDDVSAHLAYDALVKEQVFKPVLINNPEITMVYVDGINGFRSMDLNKHIVPFNYIGFDNYVEQLHKDSEKGSVVIRDSGFLSGHLTILRNISNRQTSNNFNGIMGFELRVNELTKLWTGIQLGESGYFYIVNDRGKIIYHPEEEKVGKQLDGEQYEFVKLNQNQIFELPGEPGRLFFGRKSEYSGWTLVASMSLREQKKPIATLRNTTLIIGIVTLMLAFYLAFRFGKSITKPFQRLSEAMRLTEKGQWTKVPITGKRDEVDRLIANYNTMVVRLEELVDRVYETELRNQENLFRRQLAEFQSLQMQINPHFLYNTMETIICYAVIQKSSEIKEIVRSLSYMLRYSIRTDLEEITIANELKHVLHYMEIMKYRLQHDFELDVRIHADLLLSRMVRLTLQPLVENAMIHAFPDGIEANHWIVIDAWIQDHDLIVCVEDNGCGMTEETLQLLRSQLRKSMEDKEEGMRKGKRQGTGEGIGLANVHSRVQMVFGERYGLSIDSVRGQGTRMMLRMPSHREVGNIRLKSATNRQLN